ncbi:hypothetical protein [Bradymonas sediminis]|uniref:Uncharacterized protein n=1 Tax=Bradymonas sediminis TaxID=1548548 RepID=A0A2Z4FIS0_9DELT|nr:hypothetical protein [Bradymonas sediminis]AWV88634.1 hypothetical protein DN745_04495 [Bradymonas sediminis]TDP63682.1 hypothetical protein DFR33_110140 [Bradymonas sediminis]
MTSLRSKTLIRFITIIACATLVGCAADGAVADSVNADAGVDATAQDTESTEDTTAPRDTSNLPDTQTPDAHTPDTTSPVPDAGDTATEPDSTSEPDITTEPDTSQEPTGATCAEAVDVTGGAVLTGRSTAGAGNNYNATGDNCPYARQSGGDEVFVLAPQSDTTYEILVTPIGTGYLPIVYVRADCNVDACTEGSKFRESNNAVRLTNVLVPGGESHFLIVDGDVTGTDGDYRLEITVQ